MLHARAAGGDEPRARELLASALVTFRELGMVTHAERAAAAATA